MPYVPENNVKYPDNPLAKSLQTLAQLIKMETGLRVASVDYGGWIRMSTSKAPLPISPDGLSTALGAFYNDISNHQKRVTLLVMSEFGRRLKSNKSNGTDHGHGNVMLVLGGDVKGGKMYGTWPGLENEQLDNHVGPGRHHRTIVTVLSEILVEKDGQPQTRGMYFQATRTINRLIFSTAMGSRSTITMRK